jgi:post-segregation antitoxin (ccd killing protein)
MIIRMPRVQVYLPENLFAELKSRGLPASELLQVAVQADIARQDAIDATDLYLAELKAEVGEPSTEDCARARAIVRRISRPSTERGGLKRVGA